MTAKTLRRAVRGPCVAMVGLILASLHPERTGAQAGSMRWDGALEHVSAPGGWWETMTAPAGMSRHPVSHDGRWVVFRSALPNDPYQPIWYVFRRDRMTGEIDMLFGAAQAMQPPVLSGDGNHVAFQTCDPWMRQDNQPICDVHVFNVTTYQFSNASTTTDGTESTDASDEPMLSTTGRFLVFRTNSPTLIPAGAAAGQIVLRDRDANGNGVYDETGGVSLEVVSVSGAGEAANGPSESAEISADGRFVLFRSLASNLVAGDTNNAWDVFLRDRQMGETRRLNVGWGGQQATPYLDSPAISMSADGTLIAFATDDDYLTNPPTHATDTNNGLDIIVLDTTTNQTSRVDIGSYGEQGNGHTYWPTFSADGRYLSLLSTSGNVTTFPGGPEGRAHVYVFDRVTSQTTLVSVKPDGTEPNADVSNPLISGDGSFVLYLSAATNLVDTASQGVAAIFGAAHLGIAEPALTISGKGGTATVTITAQQYVPWSSEFSEYTWLLWESPGWGMGNGTFTVGAPENPYPFPRSVTITVNYSKTIVVTQEPGLSISSIAPSSGPAAGGTLVTITGTGFEPGMTAYFDGFETPAEFVDSTTLRAVTPAHAPGLVYVWLQTSDFRWANLYPDQFRYTDTTPPQIMPGVSGDLSETGWYRSDVTVDWFVWDPESQVTSSTGCARVDVKADTGGTTFTCTATSEGGTTSVSTTVRRDATPPVILLSTPGATIYSPTPARSVLYSCTDATSGVTSCAGDVQSGQPLDMTPGFHTFGVGASDAAGNPAYTMVNYAVSMGMCVTRPAGLAAWWPFETSSGQTTTAGYKDIVSGLDATPVNTDWRFGQGAVGAFAMSTANVPSYVTAGTRPALAITGSSMTLSAWIFPTVDYDPNGAVIAGREGEYLLARFPDGTLRFSIANANPGWGWVNTYHVVPRWLWSHVVLTYNGSAVMVYVNGQAVYGQLGTGPLGDAEPALNEFRIGARQKPGMLSHFVGGIDDVQLLNRALTSDEVANTFLAGNTGLCGPRSLQLTLSPNPVRVTYGTTQQVELVASLADQGAPVAGRPVSIIRSGLTLVTGVTDDAGQVRTTTSVSGLFTGTAHSVFQADSPANLYYAQAHVFVALVTDKAVPQITWPAPAPIVFGTAISAAQLNATANIGGTFTYAPAAGTVLPAGTHTLDVSFQPFSTANYTTASATVTLDVTQATPSIQVTGGTFTYDATPHAATATATGAAGASLTPVTITYNGSSQAPVDAGVYTVVASYAGDANHAAGSASTTLTIDKATPMVTATGATFTYDAQPHAATASAIGVGGEHLSPVTLTYNGAPDVPVNAGTYDVVATFAGSANYNAASGTATVVINKATPVVDATGGTFTYDAQAHAATASATGVGGESLSPVTLTYNGSADVPVNAGSYDVVATFAGSANYNPATGSTTVTINKATPEVTATGGTFAYDGTPHAASASATGAGGENLAPLTLTYNGAADVPVNAGSYDVVATFAGSANYNAASGTATVVINKATPVVNATGGTFGYDGTPHAASASATGAGGESPSPLTLTYNGAADVPVNAGSYDVVATFAGSANYNAASGTATVVINKATPVVNATGGTFGYDGTPHAASASATGAGGESLSPVSLTYNGGATVPVNVGSYDVVATFAGSANYEAASSSVTLTISKAAPAVSATGGTFTYDGAPHAASASATGVGGEVLSPVTVTYNGSAAVPVNAGTYAVLASFAGSQNYEAGSATATVTIGKATASLQWNAPGSMVYGTALGGGQLNASASVAGSFSYTPAAGAVLPAGSGHALSATFVPADPTNYNGGSIGTTLTVVPAPLAIRANDAVKPFGAPLPAFSSTASGFVNGDSWSALTGTVAFSTPATAGSPVGSYAIVPSGVGAANYSITFVNGTLAVVRGSVAVNVGTSPEPSGMNQPMTFSAAVAAAAPSAGSPSGTVRFFDGSRLLGAATLNGGVATLATAGLDPGTRSIQAQYDGDGSFDPGSGSSAHVVNDASGTPVLTVTSSRNPSTNGQTVTLTANVSMTSGPVSGTVQFYSGGTLLGSGTISAGRATFTTTTLTNGSHAITALYTGSAAAPPSRSAVFVQAVGGPNWKNKSTTMTLSSSANPSGLGVGVVFTARVTGSQSTMPSGRILVMVDGAVVGDPAGIVVTPLSGTTAQVTLSLSNLAGGRHIVTATYLGNSTYKGSTAALTQQVN